MNKNRRVDDYRDQLKNLVLDKKSQDKIFSQSFYAKKILVSRSYLTQVLNKKKHLSYEKLDQLCSILKIDDRKSLQILESYLRLTESKSYLTKSVRKCLDLYSHKENSLVGATTPFSNPEKVLVSAPLKSLLLAICCDYISLHEIESSMRDKTFDSFMIKEELQWLLKKGFLKKKQEAGKALYKSVPGFIGTDLSPAGTAKYLAWLEHVAKAISHPEKYRPGRIQSLVLSFDDDAISKLQSELDQTRLRILELSENSQTKNSKAIYIQNLLFTLASRD